MARVKIQIDLTKPRPPHVWVGFKSSDTNKGRWQKVQYEGIPDYCMYCKHQGHIDNVCTIKRGDEDFKKRKEKEAEKTKQNKPKGDLEKGVTQHTSQQQTTVTKLQTHQEPEQVDQEEQWQIQKRKQHRNQDQAHPKIAWSPVSPPPKNTKDIMQKASTASAEGGMDGGCKEKPINLQEGVSKGGNLTHVLHEVDRTDPMKDYRASTTTIARHKNQNNHKQHNPMKGDDTGQLQEEPALQTTENLEPLQDDDTSHLQVEPVSQDTQSLNETDDNEEGDETSAHLIKAFGSTFRSAFQAEIQEVADQQGLSPRGRKQVRQLIKSASISTSANSRRPNTRSKSLFLMISTICWNARSINIQGSLERLQNFKKMYNLSMIAILEPFANNSQINHYKLLLSMDNATCNHNGKIWLFWTNDIEGEVLEIHDHHITCSMKHVEHKEKFVVSCIYVKCREQLRRPLSDILLHFSNMDIPWCTIGDFNVITFIEEKYGGIPYNMNKSLDFISIIEANGLVDIGYSGQHYTWCNQREEDVRVWKRLDRAMVNDKWLELMPQTTITHLPSVGFDHCPLLMELEVRLEHKIKYFKFLHCWTENENFFDTLKGCWQKKISGNPMWRLHQKMKFLASTLSTWSKKEYGNIFSNVVNFEEQVKAAEEDVIQQNTEENRTKIHLINAQYIKYLKLEASILKQKTQLQWFKEGDTNSKYFHSIMRGRRRKLFIHKICTGEDAWIQGEETIAKAACDYFKNMFSGHEDRIRKEILNYIPRMVTEEQKQTLQQMPNLDELTQVLFSMNPNSTAGPDGFGGKFYQHCWEIIKEDVLSAVHYFFCGYTMPKFMSHACLVLPKVEHPNSDPSACSRNHSCIWPLTNKEKSHFMKRAIADFFWGWDKEKRKYHWASWDKLSLPYDEGGIGFLGAKYCQRAHPVAKKLDTGQSLVWNFMMKNKGIAEAQIKWKINSGGTWNETMVRQWVSPLLIPKILSFPIHYQEQIPDEAIWKLTINGLFSCSSAWELIRHKGTKSIINKGIWHRHLPFKISFLVWRALRNKLPTNKKLTSFGKEVVHCSCCYRTREDNMDHIFISSHFANNIWSFFSAAAAFPYIQWANDWTDLYRMVEKCRQETMVRIVKWEKPNQTLLRLNTDGSALSNPGKIGEGGILRDHLGRMIYAFAIPLGTGTNNQVELQAASHGIFWCIQHGYKKIHLEVDSELVIKWLSKQLMLPWNLHQYITELQLLVQQLEQFKCTHTYREANNMADHLSKFSHTLDIIHQFYIKEQLPTLSKGSFILEKLDMPTFRRKRLKRIKRPP
ncbi:hypothetical protein MTR67_043505 [Solanum verrucosum]|uniref:RNase H type-1 domain-containing protein n=1 Tax=Solanum verrucosum TaxID=315347 RepID=A0AAF0ZUS5_SOLVR|nr:hypothetical protein MTR67_043505 [Solanum verrucosum]